MVLKKSKLQSRIKIKMYHLSLIARIYPCNFVFEGVGRQDTASQVTCNNNGSVKLSMEGQ